MYYLYGNPNRALPAQFFTTTVLLRDIAVVVLCALVIRQIYRPGEDLVRWGGRVDDPGGGPFDRAPDAPPGWLPGWLRPAAGRPVAPAPEAGAEAEPVAAASQP
jgi:uncharacterized membrane protein